jgi:IS30 family transposase
MTQSAIGTLVDRCSRLVKLIHLSHGHRADQPLEAIEPVLTGLPPLARLTLTWDQGSEMARHDEMAVHFAQGVFFALVAWSGRVDAGECSQSVDGPTGFAITMKRAPQGC